MTNLPPEDEALPPEDREDLDAGTKQPVLSTYAGVLAGVHGTPEEIRASIREEWEAWGE